MSSLLTHANFGTDFQVTYYESNAVECRFRWSENVNRRCHERVIVLLEDEKTIHVRHVFKSTLDSRDSNCKTIFFQDVIHPSTNNEIAHMFGVHLIVQRLKLPIESTDIKLSLCSMLRERIIGLCQKIFDPSKKPVKIRLFSEHDLTKDSLRDICNKESILFKSLMKLVASSRFNIELLEHVLFRAVYYKISVLPVLEAVPSEILGELEKGYTTAATLFDFRTSIRLEGGYIYGANVSYGYRRSSLPETEVAMLEEISVKIMKVSQEFSTSMTLSAAIMFVSAKRSPYQHDNSRLYYMKFMDHHQSWNIDEEVCYPELTFEDFELLFKIRGRHLNALLTLHLNRAFNIVTLYRHTKQRDIRQKELVLSRILDAMKIDEIFTSLLNQDLDLNEAIDNWALFLSLISSQRLNRIYDSCPRQVIPSILLAKNIDMSKFIEMPSCLLEVLPRLLEWVREHNKHALNLLCHHLGSTPDNICRINNNNFQFESPLHYAAFFPDLRIFKIMVEYLDETDSDVREHIFLRASTTPLVQIVKYHSAEEVLLLFNWMKENKPSLFPFLFRSDSVNNLKISIHPLADLCQKIDASECDKFMQMIDWIHKNYPEILNHKIKGYTLVTDAIVHTSYPELVASLLNWAEEHAPNLIEELLTPDSMFMHHIAKMAFASLPHIFEWLLSKRKMEQLCVLNQKGQNFLDILVVGALEAMWAWQPHERHICVIAKHLGNNIEALLTLVFHNNYQDRQKVLGYILRQCSLKVLCKIYQELHSRGCTLDMLATFRAARDVLASPNIKDTNTEDVDLFSDLFQNCFEFCKEYAPDHLFEIFFNKNGLSDLAYFNNLKRLQWMLQVLDEMISNDKLDIKEYMTHSKHVRILSKIVAYHSTEEVILFLDWVFAQYPKFLPLIFQGGLHLQVNSEESWTPLHELAYNRSTEDSTKFLRVMTWVKVHYPKALELCHQNRTPIAYAIWLAKTSENVTNLLNWLRDVDPERMETLFKTDSSGSHFMHEAAAVHYENILATIIDWFKLHCPEKLPLLCTSDHEGNRFLYLSTARAVNSVVASLSSHVNLLATLLYANSKGVSVLNDTRFIAQRSLLLKAISPLFEELFVPLFPLLDSRHLDAGQQSRLSIALKTSILTIQSRGEDLALFFNIIFSFKNVNDVFAQNLPSLNWQCRWDNLAIHAQRVLLLALPALDVRNVILQFTKEMRDYFLSQVIAIEPMGYGVIDEIQEWPLREALLNIQVQLNHSHHDFIKEKIRVFVERIPPAAFAVIATEKEFMEPDLMMQLMPYMNKMQFHLIVPVLSPERFTELAQLTMMIQARHIPLERATLEQKSHLAQRMQLHTWNHFIAQTCRNLFEVEEEAFIEKAETLIALYVMKLKFQQKVVRQISQIFNSSGSDTENEMYKLSLQVCRECALINAMLVERERHLLEFHLRIAQIITPMDPISNEPLVDVFIKTPLTQPVALECVTDSYTFTAWMNQTTFDQLPKNTKGEVKHPRTHIYVNYEDASLIENSHAFIEKKRIIAIIEEHAVAKRAPLLALRQEALETFAAP